MDKNQYEAILARVAKLLALGNDQAANEHEAEIALRHAAKLMAEYAIKAADVERATGQRTSIELCERKIPVFAGRLTKTLPLWVSVVVLGVAILTDTVVTGSTNATRTYAAIDLRGEAHDVAYAEYLLRFCEDAITRATAAFIGPRRDKTVFRRAMAGRLQQRMQAMHNEIKEDLKASHSTAMAVVDAKHAAVTERFGKLGSEHSKYRGNGAAMAAGASAGDNVAFNRPLTGGAHAALTAQ